MAIIKLTGIAAEITGTSTLIMDKPQSAAKILETLIEREPELGKFQLYVSLDGKIVKKNEKLTGDGSLVILGPFAGG